MENALEEVSRGMSVHAAAKMFIILNSTLHDHASGKSIKVGTVLLLSSHIVRNKRLP